MGWAFEQGGVAGGAVAGVADGEVAGELLEDVVGEDLGDEAHAFYVPYVLTVGGGDAARLLAAMLQGVEAPVGEACVVGVVVDGHDAAVLAKLVEGELVIVNVVRKTDPGVARGA